MRRHQVEVDAPRGEVVAVLREDEFADVDASQEGRGLIDLVDGTGYITELGGRGTRLRIIDEGDGSTVTRLVERLRNRGLGVTHQVLD